MYTIDTGILLKKIISAHDSSVVSDTGSPRNVFNSVVVTIVKDL